MLEFVTYLAAALFITEWLCERFALSTRCAVHANKAGTQARSSMKGAQCCVLYNGVCLTSNLNDCISITVCHAVQGIKTDVSQRAKLETVAPL
jgi:hypothetical protein